MPRDKEKKAAYDHARVELNREKKRAYDKIYAHEHREKKNAYALQWWKDHPERVREGWLRRTFNMTIFSWATMFDSQGRCCVLCGATDSGSKGWQTDHDHSCCAGVKSCGRCVRGILCWSCNTGLGKFKDSVILLRKAADYVEQKRKDLYDGRVFSDGKNFSKTET